MIERGRQEKRIGQRVTCVKGSNMGASMQMGQCTCECVRRECKDEEMGVYLTQVLGATETQQWLSGGTLVCACVCPHL